MIASNPLKFAAIITSIGCATTEYVGSYFITKPEEGGSIHNIFLYLLRTEFNFSIIEYRKEDDTYNNLLNNENQEKSANLKKR